MKLFSVIIIFLFNSISFGQILTDVDTIIKNEIKSKKIPALAVAVIESGKIVRLSANGLRDLENKLKVSINTPFHIGSVSKTVINLAIFKLVESGKIDLESDITSYLSFRVNNPHFPNDKITVHELLNHRSGIRDNLEIYAPHWYVPKGDPKIELRDFLKDYLNKNGTLYASKNFSKGSTYKSLTYSNTGYALLGLIIEQVSGSSLEEFTKNNIFEPLRMENTSWFLRNLDESLVSKTYAFKDSGGYVFKGHNGYPDYPAGQLRTSISDFSKLIVGYLNSDNDSFILKSATTHQITPIPRNAHEGFYTWSLVPMNSHIYYEHGGGDVGVRTVVAMDVSNKNAIIIFANSQIKSDNLLKDIEKQAFDD